MNRVLEEIGLPDKLVQVIRASITLLNTSIRWNGQGTNLFQSKKGLSQGDPMFPYLFVLCTCKVSPMISEGMDKCVWIGIKIVTRCPIISQSMFVDNFILFWRAT